MVDDGASLEFVDDLASQLIEERGDEARSESCTVHRYTSLAGADPVRPRSELIFSVSPDQSQPCGHCAMPRPFTSIPVWSGQHLAVAACAIVQP